MGDDMTNNDKLRKRLAMKLHKNCQGVAKYDPVSRCGDCYLNVDEIMSVVQPELDRANASFDQRLSDVQAEAEKYREYLIAANNGMERRGRERDTARARVAELEAQQFPADWEYQLSQAGVPEPAIGMIQRWLKPAAPSEAPSLADQPYDAHPHFTERDQYPDDEPPTPWSPSVGDRVVFAEDGPSNVGTVVNVGSDRVSVQWPDWSGPLPYDAASLRPAPEETGLGTEYPHGEWK